MFAARNLPPVFAVHVNPPTSDSFSATLPELDRTLLSRLQGSANGEEGHGIEGVWFSGNVVGDVGIAMAVAGGADASP